VNARGDSVPENSRLTPGKKYYLVRDSEGPIPTPNPTVVQVRYHVRIILIPIFRDETLEQVLLAIESALELRSEWEIRDNFASIAISKDQFVHEQTHYVKLKTKLSPLNELIRCDDNRIHLDRLRLEMQSLEGKQRRQWKRYLDPCCPRLVTIENRVIKFLSDQTRWEQKTQTLECVQQLTAIQCLLELFSKPIVRETSPTRCRQASRAKKNRQKATKERQKASLTLAKKTQAEKTTLTYRDCSWTTRAFANSEITSDELKRKFQRCVYRSTGVPRDAQRLDKWTLTNLDTADISGVTCVLLPDGMDYDLPNLVKFEELGKLLTRCRLTRRRKSRFWNQNRHRFLNRHREGLDRCLKLVRTEGKRRFWRFAKRSEARDISFELSIPAACGICSPDNIWGRGPVRTSNCVGGARWRRFMLAHSQFRITTTI
jgi:hypothetical protein